MCLLGAAEATQHPPRRRHLLGVLGNREHDGFVVLGPRGVELNVVRLHDEPVLQARC